MNWDLTATNADALQKAIGEVLLNGRFVKKVAIERVQISNLLRGLAQSKMLNYPVSVKHTTELVPDFQLLCNGRRITVEVTRIKFQDLECARSLQEKGLRSALSVSSLYPKAGKSRKVPAVIKEGFGVPPMFFPLSIEEEERAWIAQAKQSLDAKTSVLARQDFIHGDEDWLVLLDPVGDYDAASRQKSVSLLLENYWRPGWFSRVFLQDIFYRWQLAFTRNESAVLSVETQKPSAEALQQSLQVDESDASLFE